MMCPCRHCTNREAGCHSRCPAYISWRTKKDQEKKIQNRMKSEEVYFQDKSHWFDHI